MSSSISCLKECNYTYIILFILPPLPHIEVVSSISLVDSSTSYRRLDILNGGLVSSGSCGPVYVRIKAFVNILYVSVFEIYYKNV